MNSISFFFMHLLLQCNKYSFEWVDSARMSKNSRPQSLKIFSNSWNMRYAIMSLKFLEKTSRNKRKSAVMQAYWLLRWHTSISWLVHCQRVQSHYYRFLFCVEIRFPWFRATSKNIRATQFGIKCSNYLSNKKYVLALKTKRARAAATIPSKTTKMANRKEYLQSR